MIGALPQEPKKRGFFATLGNAVVMPFWWLASWPARGVLALAKMHPTLARRIAPVDSPSEHVAEYAKSLPQTENDLLVHGKLFQHAERAAPPAKYPWLYKSLPRDLQRSIAADGRIVNGQPMAPALAGLAVDRGLVDGAYRHAHAIGWKAGLTMWMLALYLLLSGPVASITARTWSEVVHAGASSTEVNAAPSGIQPYINYVGDVWNEADEKTAKEWKPSTWRNTTGRLVAMSITAVVGLVLASILIALALLAAVPLARAIGQLVFLGLFRGEVYQAAQEAVAALQKPYREALQRWRWRVFERDLEARAYADQVQFATEVDHSPVIDIGVAEGIAGPHGRLGAPAAGQPLRMSILDCLSHICVTGGSGEGKSRYFYKPFARQLLQAHEASGARAQPVARVERAQALEVQLQKHQSQKSEQQQRSHEAGKKVELKP